MSLTSAQSVVLDHLRSSYAGPENGPDEVVTNLPSKQYAVGMLFPAEADNAGVDGQDQPAPADDGFNGRMATDGEVEEPGASVPIAEDWRPSSVAISFVTDLPSVSCDLSGGTYRRVEADGPPRWRRQPFQFAQFVLTKDVPTHQLDAAGVPVELGSRWRGAGDGYLVTVHVRVRATATGEDRTDAESMLYQVALGVTPDDQGRIREYDTTKGFDLDDEAAELRLRYRGRKIYAVGHGMAADWTLDGDRCTSVRLNPVPSFVVPAVETTGFKPGTAEGQALRLENLARIDTAPDEVIGSLDAFVDAFEQWVIRERARADTFEGDDNNVARQIVERSAVARDRMRDAVDMLRSPDHAKLRLAFALGMEAMRLQLRQAALGRGEVEPRPAWRPFQLGFLLVALASTMDEKHPDREMVDLIWFPTGGGKTEAYLGLAAIEIFRRRIADGFAGGGTAVITRYTLRLLTAQQFQRAASLVCAMELLRRTDLRARSMAPFSIGLWVGNDVTPGTRRDAKASLDRLYKAARPEEANQFQVEGCPWCGTALLPQARSADRRKYGVRQEGHDVVIHCPSPSCEFHDELPVGVVDDQIYEAPPTILLATVDKFARLQFKPDAGRLLGLGTPYQQPSMIIQDELHLLSGPLGTTVALFDAVFQILLAAAGSRPKIVASTATIRASDDQVRGLYGRPVALYPPSGLDDDRTFFSRPVSSGEGRLYVGLMPQSLSQVSAVVAAAAPLIEIPEVLASASGLSVSRDAYWTAVMYHNSLRELGRTGTLVVDDVNGRLEPRAERLGLPLRRVRADRVLELTSRRGPEELPNDLRELGRGVEESDHAVDVVLSSNMLSVGIDIPRLALMLMVGQPKTTAEYIQATSRVGRGGTRGVVTTLFRSNRARDRSHFETFRGYHEALYRSVEPTSVTPWSVASRKRSLAGAVVALLRNTVSALSPNDGAGRLDLDDPAMMRVVSHCVEGLAKMIERSDAIEVDDTRNQMWEILRNWDRRARLAREAGSKLLYDRSRPDEAALLKRFGQSGEGELVADSMRSVEPNVAVEVREPNEGKFGGADPA